MLELRLRMGLNSSLQEAASVDPLASLGVLLFLRTRCGGAEDVGRAIMINHPSMDQPSYLLISRDLVERLDCAGTCRSATLNVQHSHITITTAS